jgi:hypothetical protein
MSVPNSSQTGEYPTINTKTTLQGLIQAIANSAAASSPQPPDPSSPASANPAVARCCQAYALALKSSTNKSFPEGDAAKAYRNAMPPLIGSRNIRDFIACTAHGILLRTIDSADALRLLSAARAASAAHKTHFRKKNNSTAISASKPQKNEHLVRQISPVTNA